MYNIYIEEPSTGTIHSRGGGPSQGPSKSDKTVELGTWNLRTSRNREIIKRGEEGEWSGVMSGVRCECVVWERFSWRGTSRN